MSYAPHILRNSKPILDVLRHEFHDTRSVLEIGSGNGQHAATFAAALTQLTWQSSDRIDNHENIRACLAQAALPNTPEALALDVGTATLAEDAYDAVFSANTAHIMSLSEVESMFALVATTLSRGGIFVLYGPFRQGGEFNAPSNASFHESLRASNTHMGIRHLEDLDRFAESGGMKQVRLYAMPANNLTVVWQKGDCA